VSRRAKSPSAGWSSVLPDGESTGDGLPPAPAAASAVFGERLDTVVSYGHSLAGDGVLRGLIGPGEVPRLWDRHLLNCGVLAPVFSAGETVCDVGSGAGLPGVVLAIARPDIEVELVEPLLRRTTYLDSVVAELGLTNVSVVRVRAEEHTGSYDWVTARAVAPMDRLAKLTLPLLRPGGSLLAFKGARAEAELAAAEPSLRRLGARDWRVERHGAEILETPTTVVRVTADGSPSVG
jgi:16S rRNA (guanine527-N7)-methyltransferase